MYKVILVDDEILIRERMAQRIPWEELDFELTAVCENGQEAIEILEQDPVDIVLTDICMPYVDGLELSKYIHEKMKNVKVVLLSGYAEFEYAKQALKYQVYSFLLKPITLTELSQVLEEIHAVLDDESENQKVHSIYNDNYSLFRSQFLIRVVQGLVPAEQVQIRMKEYGIDFYEEDAIYCTVLIYTSLKLTDYQLNEVEEKIHSISTSVLAFQNMEGGIVIFCKRENNVSIRQLIQELHLLVNQFTKEHYGVETYFLVGTIMIGFEGLHHSYKRAQELIDFLFLEKEDGIYEWDEYHRMKQDIRQLNYENNYEEHILNAVQGNLRDEISKFVYAVQSEAREKWHRKPRIIAIYQSMLITVINAFERIGIEDDGLFQKAQAAVEQLYQCNHITDMARIAQEFLHSAAEVRNSNRESYSERQAVLAMEYIDSHYKDCNLTMTELCEKLAISVSYFSTAFKDYAGKTFIEALTDRRMQEAKLLLSNSELKTYEIAERCGYRDASYFSNLFKKMVHMTPKEYAKAMKKQRSKS